MHMTKIGFNMYMLHACHASVDKLGDMCYRDEISALFMMYVVACATVCGYACVCA